jgi:pyrimidine-nucleoside phosphorylase
MKSGAALIKDVREKRFSFDDLEGNTALKGYHFAAMLGTQLVVSPADYRTFRDRLVAATEYTGFVPVTPPDTDQTVSDHFVSSLLDEKQRGQTWNGFTIEDMVRRYVNPAHDDEPLTDEHMAALIAGIMVSDMTVPEIAALTKATYQSGRTLDFSHMQAQGYRVVDKHSTGGVGDGVSLVLAPLVAAAHPKALVPMMSGRGLLHTGGTLDKLESIPGYRVGLSVDEVVTLVGEHGVGIFGQSKDLAPADGKMYALRNLIGCVTSDALIVASILGKKMSEGLDGLVMDTKTGSGAFYAKLPAAQQFAQRMCDVAARNDLPTAAFITDMNQPLALYAGNALEIHWTVETLTGRHATSQFMHLTYHLATEMLRMVDPTYCATASLRGNLMGGGGGGTAYKRFKDMVVAQGGDVRHLDRIYSGLFGDGKAEGSLLKVVQRTYNPANEDERQDALRRKLDGDIYVHSVVAERDGYVTGMDLEAMGYAIRDLGAGKRDDDDIVNPHVGVIYREESRIGRRVAAGTELAVVLHDGSKGQPESFGQYFTISDGKREVPPLVKQAITAAK